MGRQKLLLPFAGVTVIEHIVGRLGQTRLRDIVVVLGHEPERVEETLAHHSVTFALNERYEEGMLTSVRAGLSAAPADWAGALVVLGDQPSIRPATVDALLDAFDTHGEDILVPAHEAERGHPILVPRRFFPEVMTQYDELGLRGLLRAHSQAVREVTMDSPSILNDIDYPDDYRRALEDYADEAGSSTPS